MAPFKINETVDGITYRTAETEDADDFIRLSFETFYQDEPLWKSVGGLKEMPANVEQRIRTQVASGMCLIAVHQETEQTVAFMSTGIVKRSSFPPRKPLSELTEELGEFLGHIINMNAEIVGPAVLFDKYPEVDSVFYVGNAGVKREFRRRGIARRLAEIASKMGTSLNCDLGAVHTTSHYSKRLCESFKCTQLARLDYHSYVVDGRKPFNNVECPFSCAFVKRPEVSVRTMLDSSFGGWNPRRERERD